MQQDDINLQMGFNSQSCVVFYAARMPFDRAKIASSPLPTTKSSCEQAIRLASKNHWWPSQVGELKLAVFKPAGGHSTSAGLENDELILGVFQSCLESTQNRFAEIRW